MSMGSLKLLWPTVVRLVGVVSGVNWTLVKVKLAIFRSCAYDMWMCHSRHMTIVFSSIAFIYEVWRRQLTKTWSFILWTWSKDILCCCVFCKKSNKITTTSCISQAPHMQGYTPHSWWLNVANFGLKHHMTPEEAHRNVILSKRKPQKCPFPPPPADGHFTNHGICLWLEIPKLSIQISISNFLPTFFITWKMLANWISYWIAYIAKCWQWAHTH